MAYCPKFLAQRLELLGLQELGCYHETSAWRIGLGHCFKATAIRVIVATDGDFNVGASSDALLVCLIEKERDTGVYLTAQKAH